MNLSMAATLRAIDNYIAYKDIIKKKTELVNILSSTETLADERWNVEKKRSEWNITSGSYCCPANGIT